MSEKRDPLDRLADLTFPAPDPARMQADIARARARFVAAGLHPAQKPGGRHGFLARWRDRFTFGRASLLGGGLAAGLAALVILPLQRPLLDGPGSIEDSTPPAQAGYGGTEAAPLPPLAFAPPTTRAPAPSAAATGNDVTLPQAPVPAPDFPEAGPGPGSGTTSGVGPLPPVPEPPAPGADETVLAGSAQSGPGGAANGGKPVTTLPRIGPAPGASGQLPDLSRLDLRLPSEDAPFSGGADYRVAGDMDGIWLETDTGRLVLPLDSVDPGMGLQLADMFLLPAKGDLPGFLVIMGERGEERSWQIFRVSAEAITYDRKLTALLHEAVTPGQVEGMLAQLSAAN